MRSMSRIDRSSRDGDLLITVQDQGRGIPADDIDSIFQPFRSTFEKGTGLGLAIVHRIVTDYNGSIEVSSAVGVGTTMIVRLPSPAAAVTTTAASRAAAV